MLRGGGLVSPVVRADQTTVNVATTSANAAANAAITVAEKTIRVADDVGRLAKGGQKRLDREARKELERQKAQMAQMATTTISRLQEMPTTLTHGALSLPPSSLAGLHDMIKERAAVLLESSQGYS